MIIIHSGCLYGIGRILGELNFAPTIEYINVKLLPSLTEIGLLGAVWSAVLSVLAWVLPFATAAVGTNLLTQALCQRTGNESYEAEIDRQPKCFHKHIQSKFTKYKHWSPNDASSAKHIDIESYLGIK